jgi:hypothetical protein
MTRGLVADLKERQRERTEVEGGKAIHNPPRRPSATRWNTVAPGPSGSAID